MSTVITICTVLLAFIFCLILLFILLNYLTQHGSRELTFLSGKIPIKMPDGFYKGSVNFSQSIWRGKTFDRAHNIGINSIQFGSKKSEGFPFKTYVGKGNVDSKLQTLKIDYNVPQNFFLVRLVVDEVVETAPNHYLGKLEIRFSPRITLALGYFELDKQN